MHDFSHLWYKFSFDFISPPCVHGASFPLGSHRPDLYRFGEEPGGWMPPPGSATQLCLSVEHRPEAEQLLVSMLHVVNLPQSCWSTTALVKIHLLPEGCRQHQSKARHRGCEPHFGDSFVFQVSRSTLSWCTLSLSLFSVDCMKKHQPLGRVLFPLKQLNLRCNARQLLWKELEPEGDQPPWAL
ncbi:synaptotagmin-15-like [Arapaima gigas]